MVVDIVGFVCVVVIDVVVIDMVMVIDIVGMIGMFIDVIGSMVIGISF